MLRFVKHRPVCVGWLSAARQTETMGVNHSAMFRGQLPRRIRLLDTFSQIISYAIGPYLRPEPYALIDYPNYLNPGDCAIWLGTRKFLEEAHGAPPAYVSSLRNFNRDQCLKQVRNGTVYFKGGGNIGAIYSKHDVMRSKILASLADQRTIILPQSLADHPSDYETGTLGFLRHSPHTVIFARDTFSKKAIEERIGRSVPLCPDLCHVLRFNSAKIGTDTGLLLRRDPEVRIFANAALETTRRSWDWDDIAMLRVWNKLGKLPVTIPNGFGRSAIQDYVAEAKVSAALARLSKYRTLITDRLHGVILSQSIGRRVLALDNATGKVLAYKRTWDNLLNGVSIASNLDDALRQADET
ncbi:polysaccharide pyruvyl transferase family protein [Mesorhizobium sp. 10J20-29]